MSDHRYVPILRAKQGEFKALECLSSGVKARVRPLLELEAPTDPGKKSLEDHYKSFAQALTKHWGTGLEFFVEDDGAADSETVGGNHPLVGLFNALQAESLKPVPVTGLTRTAAYGAAIKLVTDATKRLCIRLEPDDFNDLAALPSLLSGILETTSLKPSEVDLLVDFGALPPSTGAMTLAIVAAFSALPDIHDWRSLTLAMTSFPERPSAHVSTASTGRIPRAAWAIYEAVRLSSTPRKPDFGDYAVDNPETELNIAPALLASTMTASIRYSTDSDWLITRGNRLKMHGYEQYRELSARLMREPEYKGASFSWGDQYISDCAASTVGTGNQTTWRQVAVNHHITLVAQQLSSLP